MLIGCSCYICWRDVDLERNGGIGLGIVFLRRGFPFLLMVHCLVSLVIILDWDKGTRYRHYCLWLVSYLSKKKLFVVVMESLSRMLTATLDRGLLSSFSVGSRNNEELLVSHLLFVDDTLIFVRDVMNNSDIWDAFSYVLKMYRGCRLIWQNQDSYCWWSERCRRFGSHFGL
jgi:hypothetical protein